MWGQQAPDASGYAAPDPYGSYGASQHQPPAATAGYGAGGYAAATANAEEAARPAAGPAAEVAAAAPWSCAVCTFRHDTPANMGFLACEVCAAPR